jgi:hypothetical protein
MNQEKSDEPNPYEKYTEAANKHYARLFVEMMQATSRNVKQLLGEEDLEAAEKERGNEEINGREVIIIKDTNGNKYLLKELEPTEFTRKMACVEAGKLLNFPMLENQAVEYNGKIYDGSPYIENATSIRSFNPDVVNKNDVYRRTIINIFLGSTCDGCDQGMIDEEGRYIANDVLLFEDVNILSKDASNQDRMNEFIFSIEYIPKEHRKLPYVTGAGLLVQNENAVNCFKEIMNDIKKLSNSDIESIISCCFLETHEKYKSELLWRRDNIEALYEAALNLAKNTEK